MIQNKILKIFISIVVAIFMILGISQNIVFAGTDINMTIKLSRERYVKDSSGVYQKKNAYVLNTGSDHPVYQIAAYNGDEIIATNVYCLNATEGYTWTNGIIGQSVSYNKAYDLVDETDKIGSLDSIYSDILNEDIYSQVMWIIDNMYTENGTTVEELLNKAGIVYGTNPVYPSIEDWHYNSRTEVWPYGYSGYHYTYNDTRYSVVLSEEEVEVVQQAAIWYFTNYIAKGDEEYNCYTDEIGPEKTNGIWFSYTESTTDDDELNSDIKGMKQEQAAILFNYLVDGANAAAEEGYDSSEEATLELSYVSNEQTIEENDTNYVVGPMVLKTTGNVTNLQVQVQTGDDYGTTIDASDVTLKNESGETITKITPGEEFTVEIPKDNVDGNIKVSVIGKGTITKKLLLVSNNTNAEQPLVEVEKQPVDLKDELIATPEITKLFDLALRKQIIAVNGNATNIVNEDGLDATRNMNIDPTTIPDTATYNHRKDPVAVSTGDIVTYKISIYNEGEIDGYASKIVDQLADNMTIDPNLGATVTSEKGNVYNVTYNEDNNQIILEIDTTGTITSLNAYKEGTLDSDSIEVTCQINQIAETDGETKHYLTNIAYIAEEYDVDGNKIEQDRISESRPDTYPTETSSDLNVTDRDSVYHGSTDGSIFNTGTNNDFYFAGQEDDDDFETVVVLPKRFDLALRKFIVQISTDGDFDNSETTTTYSREPEVDTSGLKEGSATTAEYNHSKDPIEVNVGDYVLYTLRVYNEGDIDGTAAEIVDYLPEYLDFVDSSDEYINSINSNWTYNPETREIRTTLLADTLIPAFDTENDDNAGSGLSYADVQVICKINEKATEAQKITNIAEISKYADENGERDEDIDSYPDDLKYPDDESTYKDDEIEEGKPYIPGQEDDDDFEKVIIPEKKEFDLALRKFITDISGEEVTTRVPEVSYEDGKITYEHPKDVVKVVVGDVVTYTLRVYNEGEIDGYAQEISDDIPDYLEYLPDNDTNIEYRWVMYDENGNITENVEEADKIVTDYASKEYGEELMGADSTLTENPNLLHAFDNTQEISDTNPDYLDVKVAFKVLDPNSNTYVITNKAQISEDADEDGEPVDDIDSVPDEWNEGEDDQDYENVGVEYFDLSLLKYVTRVMVTEDGTTTTTQTGNTGADTDIIPKVEIFKQKLNKTVVKFEFTIKITNEGDIAGYANEITDYVPEGLKFYEEDNNGWTDEGNNVISTRLLENTLLQPGESATVTVVLRWINGENNLGLKTNVAEISEDENDKDVPDRDSTPDNQKEGEDDIDEAPVLLAIGTGLLYNVMAYVGGAVIILIVLAGGIILIKKFVL